MASRALSRMRALPGFLTGDWADDRSEDLDYMDAVSAAAHNRGHRFAYILSTLTLAFLVMFLIWAHFAVLDEVTRGQGTVISSRKNQVIQNLEGGILSEILVHEGDRVNKGDVLVRIDNTAAQSSFEDAKGKADTLRATIARLEAEAAGAGSISFPADLRKQAPKAVADQLALFNARRQQLRAQISVLEAQVRQRNGEIAELNGKRAQLESGLGIARQQQSLLRPLASKNLVPQVEMLNADRQVSDVQGELSTVRLGVPRLQAAVAEARQRIDELRATRQTEVSDDLNKARAELDSVQQTMRAGEDRVVRTEVRAPMRGIVKQIKHNTIGGVLQPGEDIMEIVPLDDTLLIEARINPSDVAFLHPDQKAKIKITAYDFSIYGGLDAKLEQISADTIQDKESREGKSFYRVYLRTKQTALHHNNETLPIMPGMTANVEILTGKKSVLDYLLKPILKARDQALRER